MGDLLRLVQPVREVQTCNQVLGEEEGKMLKERRRRDYIE